MKRTEKNTLKKVLTIAGSDSGGGAGIQADLKTFSARGVFGMSAITAITAQNTVGVQSIFELPASLVAQQIDSVLLDIGVDAVKIGMLANKEIIDIVSERVVAYAIHFIVLDPVMIAKSGDTLLHKDAQTSLIKKLIPLTYVLTPNLLEAKSITGIDIHTIEQMKQASVVLYNMGSQNIVVKGGHLTHGNYAVDILYDGKTFYEFGTKRIKSSNTHGTGCTFASAIAAELAKENTLYQAVKIAKHYVTNALKASQYLTIGNGNGPLNHAFAGSHSQKYE